MEETEYTELSQAAKFFHEMEKLKINNSMEFLSAFEFPVGYLEESEATDFGVVKARSRLEKKTEKLYDLNETGNKIAELLLNKLQDLKVK